MSLHQAPINPNLAEFIDQYRPMFLWRLLLQQIEHCGGFSRPQEAGNDIDRYAVWG
jgi:hypothetical protein